MPDLSALDLTLLALAASLIGLSKTATPGAGTITVAVFAAVLPARESTGTLLMLLVLGDLFAVRIYRRHADWATLRRLVPAVVAGVLLGTLFLAVADDAAVRRIIGVILLALVAVTLTQRWARARPARAGRPGSGTRAGRPGSGTRARGRVEGAAYGVLGGFTTMVANAGGPVMSLYFLASRFSVNQFLGTAAWFFLVVNVAKIPFSVSLGLIDAASLRLDAVLAPAVVVGALVGRRIARRINQAVFERLVLALTTVAGAYLLVP
ncbi:sulfite exporter TauE/SafE family protein [Georgenia wangjunii]|uniref:sulfite exporter TauE/SafE family protein n=1 Tax=Georgenia wangjunii TaxID=3117730 RepID=UPI002F26340F